MEYIVVDFETKDSDGASLQHYREDFEIYSCAFAWRNKAGEIETAFCYGESEVHRYLKRLDELQTPIVVHNLSFEKGCTESRFPDLNLNWYADTMRMAQNYDAGGREFEEVLTPAQQFEVLEGTRETYVKGLGLEACATRFLDGSDHGHKHEAHQWLEENHGVTKKHGMFLHLLPVPILERYNRADVQVTLKLFETLRFMFEESEFDWTQDTFLYDHRCKFVADMYRVGTLTDRTQLAKYILKVREEVKTIEHSFFNEFNEATNQFRQLMFQKTCARYKSKVKLQQLQDLYENDPNAFNVNFNSNTQLTTLFVDILGLEPKFFTQPSKDAKKKHVPKPSFKAAHLPSWGPPGETLLKRRKRLLVLKQAETMFLMSARDGRVHFNLRACGTRTNRLSGGN